MISKGRVAIAGAAFFCVALLDIAGRFALLDQAFTAMKGSFFGWIILDLLQLPAWVWLILTLICTAAWITAPQSPIDTALPGDAVKLAASIFGVRPRSISSNDAGHLVQSCDVLIYVANEPGSLPTTLSNVEIEVRSEHGEKVAGSVRPDQPVALQSAVTVPFKTLYELATEPVAPGAAVNVLVVWDIVGTTYENLDGTSWRATLRDAAGGLHHAELTPGVMKSMLEEVEARSRVRPGRLSFAEYGDAANAAEMLGEKSFAGLYFSRRPNSATFRQELMRFAFDLRTILRQYHGDLEVDSMVSPEIMKAVTPRLRLLKNRIRQVLGSRFFSRESDMPITVTRMARLADEFDAAALQIPTDMLPTVF